MFFDTQWVRGSVMGVAALASLAMGSAVQGAPEKPGEFFIDPNLPGVTQWDGWLAVETAPNIWTSSLSAGQNPGYPSFPGSGSWNNPIVSKQGSTGHDAALSKIAGNAFPSGSSLYFGSFTTSGDVLGGTVSVSDNTPSGLTNVVFQIEIGEQGGYDFFNGVLPVLNYNKGSQALEADSHTILHQIDDGTFDAPTGPEPIYINSYLLQWDLSGITDPITSFSIDFSGVIHSQVYALRLDQSVVPEPATAGLLAGAAGLLMLRRRRSA